MKLPDGASPKAPDVGRYFEGGGFSTNLAEMRELEQAGLVRYVDSGPDGISIITEAGRAAVSNE